MPPEQANHRIAVHLDQLLEQHGMTLTDLADKVGVTVVNLSVLKNGRARAIRFSTLAALCQVQTANPATCSATRPKAHVVVTRLDDSLAGFGLTVTTRMADHLAGECDAAGPTVGSLGGLGGLARPWLPAPPDTKMIAV